MLTSFYRRYMQLMKTCLSGVGKFSWNLSMFSVLKHCSFIFACVLNWITRWFKFYFSKLYGPSSLGRFYNWHMTRRFQHFRCVWPSQIQAFGVALDGSLFICYLKGTVGIYMEGSIVCALPGGGKRFPKWSIEWRAGNIDDLGLAV